MGGEHKREREGLDEEEEPVPGPTAPQGGDTGEGADYQAMPGPAAPKPKKKKASFYPPRSPASL